IYRDPDVSPRVCLLYFHGGGLLYGSREDLPELHLKTLTGAGCVIWAFDYPLAPAARIHVIYSDAADSVNYYINQAESLIGARLPYVLWGRSAGAWLALITASKASFPIPPAGVVSFYGYGFLTDNWYCMPSSYYKKLLPPVDESLIDNLSPVITGKAPLNERYMVYIYARQTGKWKDMIYEGRDKFFYMNFTLRLVDRFPCPLFAAHSTGDTDVPYAEFTELCAKYETTRFIATAETHDFDRNEADVETANVLRKMISWLEKKCMAKDQAGSGSPGTSAGFGAGTGVPASGSSAGDQDLAPDGPVSLTCGGCKNACGITAAVKDGRLVHVTGGCHYSVKSARRQLKKKLLQDPESLYADVDFTPL
ncbi:MAG: alpha/beta hydrolase fold domain-containing protein, partial [Lachnospiraceae bacterium]|nr:alpha/beta hydrolase fold domain-containing protein [Lachnospiraceae bacterium]